MAFSRYQQIIEVSSAPPQLSMQFSSPPLSLVDNDVPTDRAIAEDNMSATYIEPLQKHDDVGGVLTEEWSQVTRTCAILENGARQIPQYNWRPLPMRDGYLTVTIVLSLALGTGQEVLCQTSQRRGGLLDFASVDELTQGQWFCWRYLPAIIVILYGIVVATFDHQVMRLAPFYSLAKKNGLRGDESLLRDPINYFWYLRHPNKAGTKVWVSSFATLLALVLIPPIQNTSFMTTTSKSNNPPTDGCENSIKSVGIDPVWSRMLTAAFLLVAICVAYLQLLLRQSSGLSENPHGIAGVMSVIIDGNVLDMMKTFSVESTKQEINTGIAMKRFALRNGAIHSITALDCMDKSDSAARTKKISPQRCIAARYQLVILSIFGAFVPIFIMISALTPARDIYRVAPWFGTACAVIYKLLWGQFEVFTRGTEPYFHLWQGCAPPSVLFVDYTGLPILLLPFAALRRKHYLLALLGFNSILAEVLVVCVASLSDLSVSETFLSLRCFNESSTGSSASGNGDVTYVTFWATLSLAATIPLIMTASMVSVWIRRRNAWLPRKPGSIASILVYVKNTDLLEDFKGMRSITTRERRKALYAEGRTYALGWFACENGDMRLSIDQEPRAARYISKC